MSTSPVPGQPIPEPSAGDDRPTGRSLVTSRAVIDLVRSAVRTSYGVTGVASDGPIDRWLAFIGVREPGIRVRLDGRLEIDLRLMVAFGLPVAEVARQVDSAVRYTIRRALEREVDRLTIHVGGLRYDPASVPPPSDLPSSEPPAARIAVAPEPVDRA